MNFPLENSFHLSFYSARFFSTNYYISHFTDEETEALLNIKQITLEPNIISQA